MHLCLTQLFKVLFVCLNLVFLVAFVQYFQKPDNPKLLYAHCIVFSASNVGRILTNYD